MYYSRKKFIIKNITIMSLILFFAIFATYNIYYKFQEERNIDYSSESLDVTFHEKSGDKINITKAVLVTDAIGLSSKAYTLSIKNNLTEEVNYKIKLVDNINQIIEDNCAENKIPKEIIRVAIKESNTKVKIFDISQLHENILETDIIAPLAEKKYTIRVWATSETSLTVSSSLHYHGTIQVVEDDNDLAIA